MKTLQIGDTGRDVEVWQRFLARVWAAEFDTMMPGVFDEATEQATTDFQERFGIEKTGLADRVTVQQATNMGLETVDALVARGVTKPLAVAMFILLIMLSILSQCVLMPVTGLNVQGTPLPLPPWAAPNSPQPPKCPGWFC
jgi:hypothetical protein